MAKRTLRYFDACVVIRLLDGEDGADAVEYLIEQAKAGHWRVAMSTLTLLEVKGPSGKLDPLRAAKIGAFFEQSFIEVVDLVRDVTDIALELHHSYGRLKTVDAGHLASAVSVECLVFYTFDKELLQIGQIKGMAILEPSFDEPTGQQSLFTRPLLA